MDQSKNYQEICKQKVGYLSNETSIYIGKQKTKTSKIINNILKIIIARK